MEPIIDICGILYETQVLYAEWGNSLSKDHICMMTFIYYYLGDKNRKNKLVFARTSNGWGESMGVATKNGTRTPSWGWKFLIFTVMDLCKSTQVINKL
jgi:hypothetical protein